MRRMALIAAVLAIAPGLAAAQRGSRTGSAATQRTTDRFGTGEQARVPSVSRHELEDLNPLDVLLDKHGDLRLTDDQVARLKTMDQNLKQASEPAFHTLDSLNLELANMGSDPQGDDAARARTMNILTRMVANGTRQRYDSAEQDARALLTADQQKKAEDVLKVDHERLDRIAGHGRGG
ncbi:MAG: hypothetical protein KGL38_14170 [Gemmatimonadota bacterium]|nr:hypothetical protein [Gemmatimonadota bacterium]